MPDKNLDAEADKEKLLRKPTKELSAKAKARKRRQEKAREMAYAKELFEAGASRAKIAAQLGRAHATITKWERVGNWIDPKKTKEQEIEEVGAESVLEKELEKVAETMVDSEVTEMLDARAAEEEAIRELAATQDTPADQYQAYVAAHSMQLLRDSFKAIRGPRTIKELSELDQIIRRSLGLNPKGGTGRGTAKLQIDINLLNNHKATPPTGKVIDAEEIE